MLVDATGTIASKLNEKEIFYFAFLSFNRSLNVEPVPHIELLTDRASFNTLESVLSTFLEDEKPKYGYRSHSVPLLCTTDCSWPILKCLVSAFNKENLGAYIYRSYKVCTDEATVADLPSEPPKTFLRIPLCHLMKSVCYKINQYFKKEKQFVKFCIILLANAGNLKDVFDICESLFKILLSTTSSSCENENNILNEKHNTLKILRRTLCLIKVLFFLITLQSEITIEQSFCLPQRKRTYSNRKEVSILKNADQLGKM